MSCRYVIDKERRLIITVGEGRVNFVDVLHHQNRLLNDSEFDPNFNQLIDLSTAVKVDISAAEGKILAERSVVSSSSRRALVTRSPIVHSWARLVQYYHGARSSVHVFFDRDGALRWLGLTEQSGLY